MNGRALGWSLVWGLAALLIAGGLLPGSGGWATGPRIGITVLFAMLSITVLLAGNASWFLRKTTKPDDYEGGCPVGAKCGACDTFNMKPRAHCKKCKEPMVY